MKHPPCPCCGRTDGKGACEAEGADCRRCPRVCGKGAADCARGALRPLAPPPRNMLHMGDCFDVMAGLPDGCVDVIVTDPPYGIHFMGEAWDKPALDERKVGHGDWHSRLTTLSEDRQFQAWTEQWALLALRLLKPGGHLLAMGATRLYHRTACGIQDAGFEMRDSLAWIYGSGFPKSHNCKATGRGTALKPAWEPIVMARKPPEGTVRENDQAHGTGYLDIDAARVPLAGDTVPEFEQSGASGLPGFSQKTIGEHGWGSRRTGRKRGGKLAAAARSPKEDSGIFSTGTATFTESSEGRWPANVAHDGSDAVLGEFPHTASGAGDADGAIWPTKEYDGPSVGVNKPGVPTLAIGDAGSAARFFMACPWHPEELAYPRFKYCPKPSPAEKEAGLEALATTAAAVKAGLPGGNGQRLAGYERANIHPTAKPIELMRWLIRLACPMGGIVLDPFAGSGTTPIAAILEGRRWIGIEREEDYAAIAQARIDWWAREAARKPGRTVAGILGAAPRRKRPQQAPAGPQQGELWS